MAGWAAYAKHWDIFKSNLAICLKRQVYNSCVLPAMTYGAETWTLTKQAQNKLAAAQTKMERSMLNITYKDRRTNIWVRERTKLIDIIYTVRKNEMVLGRAYQPPQRRPMDLARHHLETIIMTRKDVKGDQPSGGETTWTNTGATRYGRGQHKTGSFGDDMLRPSPNHGTQRLPNDDDDDPGACLLLYNVCLAWPFYELTSLKCFLKLSLATGCKLIAMVLALVGTILYNQIQILCL